MPKKYPKDIAGLNELFETLRKESQNLHALINTKKNHWSRDMLRVQTKRARELSRERNHVKMLIETNPNLPIK